ncbi:nad-dependent deacetylase sirtuin-2 [Stylonychia lemnae]|uniref:Nad-dependent deacetylase sirtuin-2 n=1 Tax=Stylonychia lemnae TaxID=5949 RepID=A0A078B2P2_STYLE|nr:nad-dependent deacetylase sirtuin-2 [Stylonychia lemnae]|eukprot:CDW88506.1 nad-dependent deacetylase sirtuin-2 [Stylonychia lemnae]
MGGKNCTHISEDSVDISENANNISISQAINHRRKLHKCENGLSYCKYICLICMTLECDMKTLKSNHKMEHSIFLNIEKEKLYCVSCNDDIKGLEKDQNFGKMLEILIEKTKIFKEDDIVKRRVITKFSYRDLIDGLTKKQFKKIVIMTGAGISVSAGIPDFRSPGSGVYANLAKYNLPFPEAIFTLPYFIENPEAFYTFCQEFDLDIYKPTPTHLFITLLDQMGVLLMNYTQNIDNLEEKAGLDVKNKLLQAHGSASGAKCAICKMDMDEQKLKEQIKVAEVYRCLNQNCKGPVKPNIVLFGEAMPSDFFKKSQMISSCDLLLIMGTALAVSPFNSLVSSAPKNTPKVLINRENLAQYGFDFLKDDDKLFLEGNCDDIIQKIVKDCEWEVEFANLNKL